MPANRKLKKTSSDDDLRLLQEQELEQLERQYQIMHHETKNAKNYVKNYIKDQHVNILNRLDYEIKDTDANLNLATGHAVQKKDAKNLLEIKNLKKAESTFQEVVLNEKEKSDKLDVMIKNLEKEIEEQSKKSLTGSRNTQNIAIRLKRINVYENRLNTGTVQFNKLLTENTNLRDKIEHFRKERQVFNNLYTKLQSKSKQLKFHIDDVITTATQFYNIRDDNQTKMNTLKDRNQQDKTLYAGEVKEMTRTIEQTRNLTTFMNLKNSQKSEVAYHEAVLRHNNYEDRHDYLEEKEMKKFENVLENVCNVLGKERGEKLINILNENGNESTTTLCPNQTNLPTSTMQISKPHQVHHKHNNHHEKLDHEKLQKIKIEKLTTAIQPVCDRYKKTEEQNYSLFQFNNEVVNDIKLLEEKIVKTENEHARLKFDIDCKKIDQHKEKIFLEEDVGKTGDYCRNLESKLNNNLNQFSDIKRSINILFQKLNCNDKKLSNQLNHNNQVTIDNFERYLSSIENKLNQLIEKEALKIAIDLESESEVQVVNGKSVKMNKTANKKSKKSHNNRDDDLSNLKNRRKSRFEQDIESSNKKVEDKKLDNSYLDFVDDVYGELNNKLMDFDDFELMAEGLINERAKVAANNQTRRKSMANKTL